MEMDGNAMNSEYKNTSNQINIKVRTFCLLFNAEALINTVLLFSKQGPHLNKRRWFIHSLIHLNCYKKY